MNNLQVNKLQNINGVGAVIGRSFATCTDV